MVKQVARATRYDEDVGDEPVPKPTSKPKPSSGRAPRKPTSQTPSTAARPSTTKNESIATAIAVETRLPQCVIGAVEMLTFFPHHTGWPEAGLRVYRNGWNHMDIAKVQVHARGKLEKVAHDRRSDSLKHQVGHNGKIFFGVPNFAPTKHEHLMTAVLTYDASNYVPRNNISSSLMDARLVDIARGVVNWPTGEDRGIVTQAIEHAYQNDLRQYTAADIPILAQQMGFTAPGDASSTDWDQRALQRVRQIPNHSPRRSFARYGKGMT